MTISIGRFGNGAAGYTIATPTRVDHSGDSGLRLAGIKECTSAAQMKAVRQNVLGLSSLDERIVPVVFSDDSDYDGFYFVRGSNVDQDDAAVAKNRVHWSVDLERLPDYALPQIELVLEGGFRTNSHAITPDPLVWIPNSAVNVYFSAGPSSSAAGATRTCEDGSVLGAFPRASSTSAAERALLQYMVGPSDWYDGACRVEASYGGTYYPIVGRNPYSLLSSSGWRITNGRLRVAPSSTAGRIDVSVYDTGGAAWETKTWKLFGTTAGSDITEILTWAVLRNTPQEVAVRLGLEETTGAASPSVRRHTLDVTLRRGCHHAEFYWFTDHGSILGSVERNTAEAGTAVTGGVRATANDAAGNRYVCYTPRGKTNDTVNGGFDLSAANDVFPFALGVEYGGSGATGYDAESYVSDEYFGAYAGDLVVSGR